MERRAGLANMYPHRRPQRCGKEGGELLADQTTTANQQKEAEHCETTTVTKKSAGMNKKTSISMHARQTKPFRDLPLQGQDYIPQSIDKKRIDKKAKVWFGMARHIFLT